MTLLLALMLFYKTSTGEITGAGPIEGATVPAGQASMSISQTQFDDFQARVMQGEVPRIVDGKIAYSPPGPAQFATGVAVPIPDSDGSWYLLQPVADGEPAVALQISSSPIGSDWSARKAAALATNNLIRLAIRDDLQTIRSNMVVNIADSQAIVTTNFPAGGQRQTIADLRRELIDLAQEVQRLRKVVATMNRKD